AREHERVAPADRALDDRRRMALADHERDADESHAEERERRACGAHASPSPEDEGREQRAERHDQRGALRSRVREPRVREEVEAGEAERAEPEETPAAPVEP